MVASVEAGGLTLRALAWAVLLWAAMATPVLSDPWWLEPEQQRGQAERLQSQQGQPANATLWESIFDLKSCAPYPVDGAPDPSTERREAHRQECNLRAQESVALSTRLLLFITIAQTVLAIVGTVLVLLTLKASKDQIEASRDQIRLSHEAMVTDQRAWLSASLMMNSGLEFTPQGIRIVAYLQLKNIGRTPALKAHTNITVAISDLNFKHFCSINRTGRPGHELLVLPGQSLNITSDMGLSNEVMDQADMKSSISPTIYGCVTYQDIFSDQLHQTGFLFHMVRKPWQVPIERGQNLNQQELDLKPGAGGFAD